MECVSVIEIVRDAAFALWALVVVMAVRELNYIRKVLEKNGD